MNFLMDEFHEEVGPTEVGSKIPSKYSVPTARVNEANDYVAGDLSRAAASAADIASAIPRDDRKIRAASGHPAFDLKGVLSLGAPEIVGRVALALGKLVTGKEKAELNELVDTIQSTPRKDWVDTWSPPGADTVATQAPMVNMGLHTEATGSEEHIESEEGGALTPEDLRGGQRGLRASIDKQLGGSWTWDESVLANAKEGTHAWNQGELWEKNNPGGLRRGGNYDGETGVGDEIATFVAAKGRSAIENGLLALTMNISAHRRRSASRTIDRGPDPPHDLEVGTRTVHPKTGAVTYPVTIEGGLKWAYDEFVTHAPYVENKSRLYYDAYAGVAKELGVYDGGKLNDTGDQRLVIMLVMHSREIGISVPYSPYETIDALGEAQEALPDGGRGDAEFAKWAKTATRRWSFERIENNRVRITRRVGDDEWTVVMDASGSVAPN